MRRKSPNPMSPSGINVLGIKFPILLALGLLVSLLYIRTWFKLGSTIQIILMAYLVPLISLYFRMAEKGKFKPVGRISNTIWGAIILGLSLALYLMSYAGGIAVSRVAMIIFSLSGLVLFTLGKEIFSFIGLSSSIPSFHGSNA